MAVMSFAHLKKDCRVEAKDKPEASEKPSQVNLDFTEPVAAGGVFEMVAEETIDNQQVRTTYRIPAVAESALLIKVNYCVGCPRFCRAGDEARYELPASKCGYGWCWRTDKEGRPVWKDIPANATVGRCACLVDGLPK